MHKTLNRIAALICLAGGASLAATPAPATGQASYPDCRTVVRTYCPTPGATSTCMLGGYEQPIYCQSNHGWMYY